MVDELRRLGFFEPVPSERAAAFIQECLQTHWLFEETGGRMFFADAENLAEGGIGDWLQNDAGPHLRRRGIAIPTVDETVTDDSYTIQVGARTYPVHTSQDDQVTMWRNGCIIALRIVNDLLSDAKHAERLYWLRGAEDGVVALMTPKMFETITAARLLASNGWPYAKT